jgi:hypothetical protein
MRRRRSARCCLRSVPLMGSLISQGPQADDLDPDNSSLGGGREAAARARCATALYPAEYATPVQPTADGTSGIVALHSLISDALYHAFATFGVLMSPELSPDSAATRADHHDGVRHKPLPILNHLARRVSVSGHVGRCAGDGVTGGLPTAPLTDQERAMLDYVVQLTKDATRIESHDPERLRAVGFDDRGILQNTLMASWFNYINRVADALGVGRD